MHVRGSQIIVKVIAPAVDTLIVGPNIHRVALCFPPAQNSTLEYWINNAVMTGANQGWLIGQAGGGYDFTIERHGSIVQQEWHGFHAGGANIAVVEVVETP